MVEAIEFLSFALGAVVASFIGVVVARLQTGESFLTGRSRCDVCGTPLTYASLIPIISYLIQGGRARCCGARLSPLAPLSEFVLGALFALSSYQFGLIPALVFILIALSLILALVLYDLTHQILPTSLLTLFITCASISGFLLSPSREAFLLSLSIAVILAFVLLTIHFLSRGRAMGFADAPLTFGLALLVGPLALSGFIYSFWIGAVVGIALLARRPGGFSMGVEIPFAPFLASGFLLAFFTQWNLLAFVVASA